MTWPPVVLLVIACGVVALWWLCRCLARQDADEAHRNLARLVVDVWATHASPLRGGVPSGGVGATHASPVRGHASPVQTPQREGPR